MSVLNQKICNKGVVLQWKPCKIKQEQIWVAQKVYRLLKSHNTVRYSVAQTKHCLLWRMPLHSRCARCAASGAPNFQARTLAFISSESEFLEEEVDSRLLIAGTFWGEVSKRDKCYYLIETQKKEEAFLDSTLTWIEVAS